MPTAIDFEPEATIDFTPEIDFQPDEPSTATTVQPLSENVGLQSPESLRQDPRYYRKPPGMIDTAFGAVGEAAADALNIPQAMVRSATGETPKQFKISPDATGKEQLTQEEVPLHFQSGKPAIEFPRTEFQPEGNAIGRLIEGFLTPENIALFPFAAAKPVQAAFLAQTVPGAVEAASRLIDPKTPLEARREASTELLINGLMSYGIAKHLTTKNQSFGESQNLPSDPSPGKGISYGPSGDANLLSDTLNSNAFKEKGFGALDIPSQGSVMSGVIRTIKNLKIDDPVIQSIPVPVMDVLSRVQPSTKVLLHDPSVLPHLATVQGDGSVSMSINIANSLSKLAAAHLREELHGEKITKPEIESIQKEIKDASEITIPTIIPEPEIRTPVGESPPLRQQGEAAGVPTPEGTVRRGGTGEANAATEITSVNAQPPKETPSPAQTPIPLEGTVPETGVKPSKLTSEWDSATESLEPMPPESGPIGKAPEFPKIEPQELGAGVSIPKFEIRKMTPLDVATTRHSAKMQRSESNARRAVKEIRKLAKSEDRQSAIALWVEAAGDQQTLHGWASTARGKKFKQAATDALTLTPEEVALGQKVRAAFDALLVKGMANKVVTQFRDNYVPHIWERPKRTGGFGGGTLKQNFKFNKARTFNTFFEGDQAGFTPKTLALERIVPAYIKEMDSVIAARQFVKDMAGQLAPDGRPLVIPRGTAKEVTGTSGTATLVFPKALKSVRDAVGDKIDQSDYKTMENQPALQKWSWVAEDQAGNPIMLQADLSLHPKAYDRIHAMLGKPFLKEWYNRPSEGAAQIPKVIVKALDAAQSEMKKSMFGLLSPFHQVQEGWHGIGHTVNPTFGIPKIDLRDPAQLDAAAHGLMLLPDKASSSAYLEGSGSQSSLIVKGLKKVPGLRALGEASDMYQDYLFHQYIPGLKFKTYEHILERNTKRFQPELVSGEVTLKDIKLLSAEQSNAAYGHLNYALLDRNPTIQHFLRLSLLAPDFLEARARFAGQAVKGLNGKVGQEQLRAIAFLAAVQAGSAFVISQLLGTQYDPKHPFEVLYNGRRYTLRSVPEDIFSLVKDTRSFAYSRINPLIAKGAIQYTYGLNYRGEKVSALDTTEELLAGYIPITARSIPGVRELTETSRRSPITPMQQFSGSMGMRISRFSPISETYGLANDWKDAQKLPKDKGSYPVSKYQQLRYALEDGDMSRAAEAYAELRKTMTPAKITTGFAESVNHPFTGSLENDRRFKASLTGYDKEMYDLAVRTRANILNAYRYVPKK